MFQAADALRGENLVVLIVHKPPGSVTEHDGFHLGERVGMAAGGFCAGKPACSTGPRVRKDVPGV
jgi:hypothetical protein